MSRAVSEVTRVLGLHGFGAGEVGCGVGIEIGCVGQSVRLDPQMSGVEQVIGHLAQVADPLHLNQLLQFCF